jgi:hypothetical protein
MMSKHPVRFKLNRKVEKKVSIRLIKPLSLLLGVWMFMFGLLKFFPPFSGWFDIQIQQSHLPHEAILAAKLGEMATGILFLLPWSGQSLAAKSRDSFLLIACGVLVTQMSVAIYVHLEPRVPANVLPLGIKPPVIPSVVLALGLLTAFLVWSERRRSRADDMLA